MKVVLRAELRGKQREPAETHLDKVPAEPTVPCHRALEVDLAADCELACIDEESQQVQVAGYETQRKRTHRGWTD